LDVFCGVDNWEIIIVKKGNEIAVTMPLFNSKKMVFRFSRMPILCKYLGPYFPKKFRSQKQQEKLIKELIKQLPPIHFFEQNLNPSIFNWLPFYWAGFEATERYTFMIDLSQTLESIYGKISSNYRNNKIAKANNILQIVSDQTLEGYYAIQKKNFKKKGLTLPFSLELLKNFDFVLEQYSARKVFFAIDKKNQIHAVSYLIWDEKTAYLLMTESDPAFRNSGAGIFIIWESIKFAKEVLEKTHFDFMGSVIENVAKVRQEFGAEQVGYLNLKKIDSSILEILYKIK